MIDTTEIVNETKNQHAVNGTSGVQFQGEQNTISEKGFKLVIINSQTYVILQRPIKEDNNYKETTRTK